jgi:hypothetical protein
MITLYLDGYKSFNNFKYNEDNIMPININDLSKFNVAYAKQVDFKLLKYNLNVSLNQQLQLATEPHPVIILEILPKDNLVVCLFGQSIKESKLKEFNYKYVGNDYIIIKSELNGLTELTLFQLHSRNINLLECTDVHFKRKKGSYILGKLSDGDIAKLALKFATYPQVQNIIDEIKKEGYQVLPLKLQKKKEFKLPLTKITKKK